MSLIDNIKNYTKEYALPIGVSSAIIISPFLDKFSNKPTYAQVIEKIAENNYKVMENKGGETAILFHKVGSNWKFDPNYDVLNSIKAKNPAKLQEWYDNGLIKKVEEIKEPEAKLVYKILIDKNVKPFLVKEGYAKQYTIPLSESQKKNLEDKTKKIYETTKDKSPLKIEPVEKKKTIDTLIQQTESQFSKHSDQELLDSYIKTNQYIKSEEDKSKSEQDNVGLGNAYSQLVKLKDELTSRKISTEAYNHQNIQKPTAEDIEKKNIRIIERLKESPELLNKLVKDYPEKYQRLAKRYVLEGLSSTDEFSLAFSQDSLGYYITFGDYLKSKGPGQIDKLVTFADLGTAVNKIVFGNPRDYSEGGKYYDGYTEGEGSITDILIAINNPINKAIFGKPLDPNNVPIGYKAYLALNDNAISLGVPKELVKFSQGMIKPRLGTFLYADVIEKLIYTEKELKETLGREEQLAKQYSNIEVLRAAMEDLIAQANNNFGNYNISQIDNLAKAGSKDAINFLKLFNQFQEQYTSLGNELTSRETDIEKLAVKNETILQEKIAMGEEKAKLITKNAEVNSLYNLALENINKLKSEVNAYEDSTVSLNNLLNQSKIDYGILKTDYSNLSKTEKEISAKVDSLVKAVDEERIRAKEAEGKVEDLEKKLKRKWSGGFYINSLYNNVDLKNVGFYFGMPDLGYIKFGLSTKSEETHIKPKSEPMTDPLRPKLTGEIITTTTDILKGNFVSVGIGKDYNIKMLNDKDILSIFADIGLFWSELGGTMKEDRQFKNKEGITIAQDIKINENPGAYDTKDWMLDFGVMYLPNFAQGIKIPLPFTDKRLSPDIGIIATILLSKDQYYGWGITIRP